MLALLHTIGWLACVVYATIPSFWLIIHPRAEYWRLRGRSPTFSPLSQNSSIFASESLTSETGSTPEFEAAF